ncbi:hypothetical protein D3C74_392790 [compost metagenome]
MPHDGVTDRLPGVGRAVDEVEPVRGDRVHVVPLVAAQQEGRPRRELAEVADHELVGRDTVVGGGVGEEVPRAVGKALSVVVAAVPGVSSLREDDPRVVEDLG